MSTMSCGVGILGFLIHTKNENDNLKTINETF
jgi:hypothetical protein